MTRESLAAFIEQVCDRVDMSLALEPYFWDEINGGATSEPNLKGVSVFQFIETSNIVIHALTMLEVIFFNIFSCKPFAQQTVEEIVKEYFRAKHIESQLIERTYVARLREKS